MHMTFVYSVSFRDTWIHFRFEKGSFCSIFNFLCSILLVIICFCFYFVLSFGHCVISPSIFGGRRGRDRMIVGFITTYAISAKYH